MKLFNYHGTTQQKDRVAQGLDHCAEDGTVYTLADLIKDGYVCLPGSLRLTTVPLDAKGWEGKYIYAVCGDTMRIAADSDRKKRPAVKHETLFHNADVEAAGEIYFREGIVEALNDQSGTYRTIGHLKVQHFRVTLRTAFDRANARLSGFVQSLLLGDESALLEVPYEYRH